MCWIVSETIFKNDFIYLFTLYILIIPAQFFVVSSGIFSINISVFKFSFSFIFLNLILFKYLIKHKKKIKIKIDVINLIFLMTIFSLISLFNAHHFHIAVNGIIYTLLVPLLLNIVLINIIKDKNDLFFLIKSINFTLFVYNFITFSLSISNSIFSVFSSNRIYGLYMNPVYFGFAQIISAAASLFLIFKYSNIFYKITFILSLIGVFYSGSRGAIISVLVVCLILLNLYIKSFDMKFIIFNISIILLAIILLIGPNYIDFTNIQGISRFLEKGVESARYTIWKDSINYIMNNNLFVWGIGLGNFLYTTYDEIGWSSAHNSFLQMSTTIGFIGALFFHMFILFKINIINILLKKDIYSNFTGVVILGIFIYMNVVGFVPVFFARYDPLNFRTMDINFVSFFLWFFIALSYKIKKLL
jgi:hypothetical protein